MKILVVDDEFNIRLLVKEALETTEMDEVVEAASGEKAIEIIEKQPIDLVITDLVMQELSGLDVLKMAKNMRPCIEVIVITGHASLETAIEAMRLGARDYIEKPLSLQMLLAKVKNVRDYFLRFEELENSRFAKELFEANAARSLVEMEKSLYFCREKLRSISGIVDAELGDAEKLNRIVEVLSLKKDESC